MFPCRILSHETADGPANMALDEALLNAVAATPEFAYFRTYEWTEPTLSLGYFQRFSEAKDDPRLREAALVRRPTGGGAIWHHHEVTYAIIMPSAHPSARRGGTLYHDVHAAIAQAFQEEGAPVVRRGSLNPIAGDSARPFLCFQDRDAEDLVLSGSKVVGSAQRRRAGAVLQHGSILLARSNTIPELPGAEDLAAITRLRSFWAERLRTIIPAALGLTPVATSLTPADREHASELEATVYRTSAWNQRR